MQPTSSTPSIPEAKSSLEMVTGFFFFLGFYYQGFDHPWSVYSIIELSLPKET
jgi:hypothetical protein